MVFSGSVWFGERLLDLVLPAECGSMLSDESVLVVGLFLRFRFHFHLHSGSSSMGYLYLVCSSM